MDENIDAELAKLIKLTRHDLEVIMEDDSIPVYRLAAAKIILDALDRGGMAMTNLADRLGGKPITKNINVNMRNENVADKLALALGKNKKAITSSTNDDDDSEIVPATLVDD